MEWTNSQMKRKNCLECWMMNQFGWCDTRMCARLFFFLALSDIRHFITSSFIIQKIECVHRSWTEVELHAVRHESENLKIKTINNPE